MTRTTDLRTIHSEEYHILLAKLQESVRDIVQTLKLLEDVSNSSSALVDYEDKVVRDIEHLLEFEKLPVGSYAKLSSEIRQSRQRRRKHVNIVTAIIQIGTFLIKFFMMAFVYIWVRWTVLRFRYDQLQMLGWKVLIPLALLNIVITAIFVVVRGN